MDDEKNKEPSVYNEYIALILGALVTIFLVWLGYQ